MASNKNYTSDHEEYISETCSHLRFSQRVCSKCNFPEKSESDYRSIAERLNNLPKIKASNRFDQKMAAAFAMELQKEEVQKNRSWLKKNRQISLPDVSTDLIKNLF